MCCSATRLNFHALLHLLVPVHAVHMSAIVTEHRVADVLLPCAGLSICVSPGSSTPATCFVLLHMCDHVCGFQQQLPCMYRTPTVCPRAPLAGSVARMLLSIFHSRVHVIISARQPGEPQNCGAQHVAQEARAAGHEGCAGVCYLHVMT
jgi:hypothetical protein